MDKQPGRLAFFPVNLFGGIMGYMGLTLAFFMASQLLGFPRQMFSVLLAISTALFALLALIYGLKALKYPQALLKEFNHPVAINFSPPLASACCCWGPVLCMWPLMLASGSGVLGRLCS